MHNQIVYAAGQVRHFPAPLDLQLDRAAPLRREAITIHLRGLAAARPEHREAITKLIEIFAHAD